MIETHHVQFWRMRRIHHLFKPVDRHSILAYCCLKMQTTEIKINARPDPFSNHETKINWTPFDADRPRFPCKKKKEKSIPGWGEALPWFCGAIFSGVHGSYSAVRDRKLVGHGRCSCVYHMHFSTAPVTNLPLPRMRFYLFTRYVHGYVLSGCRMDLRHLFETWEGIYVPLV